jgi:hypothetical protein
MQKFDSLFVRLISHQQAVIFSQNKPATSNQSAVLFSQNKSAPVISHQPNEQAVSSFLGCRAIPAIVSNAYSCSLKFCEATWRFLKQLFILFCGMCISFWLMMHPNKVNG